MTDEVQLLGNCVTCKVAVNNFATHWRCSNPKCPAIMCEDCTLNEERHAHPMNKVKGEKRELVHFEFVDKKKSGNVLFLSECTCAVPGAITLQAKNIKSVLSVMDFDGAIDGVKELREVYYKKGKPYRQTAICKGVVYHHVPVPDYRDPAQLSTTAYTLPDLLCETTVFIDEALKRGNVLLHCQLGQRRSPTILTAWLITRGMTVDKAIDFISANYVNQRDWGRSYRKERAKWITKLHAFKKKYPELRKYWRSSHEALIEGWSNVYDELENHEESAESSSSPEVQEKKHEAKPKIPSVSSSSEDVADDASDDKIDELSVSLPSESEEEKKSEEYSPESNKENESISRRELPEETPKTESKKVTTATGKQTSLANFFSSNKRKRDEADTAKLPAKKLKK